MSNIPVSPSPQSPQPRKVIVQPPPDPDNDPTPPVLDSLAAQPPLPIPTPPTQEELAALTLAQQNVRKPNEMVPLHKTSKEKEEEAKPVKRHLFTDADRTAALEARSIPIYDWEDTPLDEALSFLAELRAEIEKAGLILQRRVSEHKVEKVKCFGCDNIIDLSGGHWVKMKTRNNWETGLPESAYACSHACSLKMDSEFGHPVRVPTTKES